MKKPPRLLAAFILACMLVPAGGQAGSFPAPGAARKAARDGYIFLYPLVMNYRLMFRQAIDRASPSFSGGFGAWTHYGPASPDLADYPSPGVDTLYSASWVDLRAEPWVFTVPPSTDGRYVMSQWDDLWGFVLDTPGVVLDGEAGGSYLLAPPGWKGEKPKGIKRVIMGESAFMGTLTRTEVMSMPDLPGAKALREGFTLRKLSAFLDRDLPPPAPDVSWPAWKEGSEKTPDFFGYACFLLPFTVPHPKDRPMLQRLAEMGVLPGAHWDSDSKGPGFRKAIQEGIDDAREELSRAALKTPWSNRLFSNRQTLGDDYLNRCLGAYTHLFGAVPSQIMYCSIYRDAQGAPLDGGGLAYTLTFPLGGTPPGRFFWSVTAYSLPGRGLAPNALGRHAVGTHSLKLHKGADGSITLFLRKSSPGKDRELNWLPIPAGPFFVTIRSCGPDRKVIFHTWKPPLISREGEGGGNPLRPGKGMRRTTSQP